MASPEPSQAALGKRKQLDDSQDGLCDDNFDESNADDDLDLGDDAELDDGEVGEANQEDTSYSEGKEQFPKCAAYDPHFSEIGGREMKLVMDAKVILNSHNCNSEDVIRLRKRAEEVSTLPQPQKSMIGFLGDAGAGKSSLLNSITDTPDLAMALDPGESCTYVVTLYHGALPSQRQNFSATIEYFDLETIGRLLVSSLDDWHLWRFRYDPTWESEILNQNERRAFTCLSTFRAIFCKAETFQNEETAKEALDELVQNELNRAEEVDLYVQAVAEELSEKQQPNGNYEEYYEFDTAYELRGTMDPLLQDNLNYDEVTLQVDIGVRGSRVLEKHTIADLPGISDTNQVRVKATFDQIDKCDEIWIVGRAGRIINDDVVDGLLQQYGKISRGHVAVIVAKSDENVNHQLAVKMYQKGYQLGDYLQLKKASEMMDKELTKLKDKKCKLEKLKGKLSANRRQEKLNLLEEMEGQVDVQRNLDSQRFGLVVRARNTHIIESLQREKQRHLPKGKVLDVVCVSNLHYAAHKGDAGVNGPLLNVDATGISELRDFALSLAAPKVMRALEDFTRHELSVFFKGLDLWARQELVGGRKILAAIVQKPQDQLDGIIQRYKNTLRYLTDDKINEPLQNDIAVFQNSALDALDSLRSWHFSTLKAFMRRYSNHRTSAMPHQSWNQKFTQASTEAILELWEKFSEMEASLVEEMQKEVLEGVNGIIKKLHHEPAAVTLPMQIYEDAVAAHIRGIQNRFRDYQEAMEKKLRTVLSDATVDRETSFFLEAMRECYDTCIEDSGKGVKERWMATFRTHLTLTGDRSPFVALARSIQANIIQAADKQCRVLQTSIQPILHAIVQNFDSMITKAKKDSCEIPVRRAIREFLVEGNPRFEEIKSDLERLSRAYGTR